jgi:hypothetical protein
MRRRHLFSSCIQCGVYRKNARNSLFVLHNLFKRSAENQRRDFTDSALSSPRVMTITEPVTLVTDYLLALAGILFGILTFRLKSSHRAMPLWILAFTCSTLAAISGGTVHGFKEHLSPWLEKWLWDNAMIFIGGTAAFLIAATIISSLRRKEMPYVHWLKRGLTISAVGFLIQKIGWNISPDFNHNDLYHMIQIAGFWCLWQGIKRIPEK